VAVVQENRHVSTRNVPGAERSDRLLFGLVTKP